jgi:predicted ribosomally synthesized peptide with nif11-like leader
MSIESAKAFMERIVTDKEFAEKLNVCKDWETVQHLITSEGFDFTREELKITQIELADDELAPVAGGMVGRDFINNSSDANNSGIIIFQK